MKNLNCEVLELDIEEAIKIINELIDSVEEYGYDYIVEEAVVINKSEYNSIETLLTTYEKEKEKNKKAVEFIDDKNNYFEDGENWQNVLKIKEILEE